MQDVERRYATLEGYKPRTATEGEDLFAATRGDGGQVQGLAA